MMAVLQSVLAFIVALGILVAIHEYGHFWVARRLGVKILRYSLGFGRPLYTRRFGPDNTEFVVAAIPLGGYVKMLDEREGDVSGAERHRAFNRQPLATRTAIVAAGPLANFAFAVFAYWLMFVVGVTGLKPIVGEVTPNTPAALAGLERGDEIVSVDGGATPTWETVLHASIGKILDAGHVEVGVRDRVGNERTLDIDLSGVKIDDLSKGNFFRKLGAEPFRVEVPAVIGEVLHGGAAERAGFRAGDEVVGAGAESIDDWETWVRYVQSRPGEDIAVEVLRGGERVSLTVRPDRVETDTGAIGRIGAAVDASRATVQPALATEQYGVFTALGRAVAKTWDMSVMTLRVLGKMLFGEASVENLSGPISIAQYAGQSASIGATAFVAFLAIVSVSLGVLNLLPIPLLDGGHLFYYLVEFVTRRPVSEDLQAWGQQVGLVVLVSLMGLAFYNDIMRIF